MRERVLGIFLSVLRSAGVLGSTSKVRWAVAFVPVKGALGAFRFFVVQGAPVFFPRWPGV